MINLCINVPFRSVHNCLSHGKYYEYFINVIISAYLYLYIYMRIYLHIVLIIVIMLRQQLCLSFLQRRTTTICLQQISVVFV